MNSKEISLSDNFDFQNFSHKMGSKYKAVSNNVAEEPQQGLVSGFFPFADSDQGQPTDTDYKALKLLIRNVPDITAPVMRMADYTIGSSQGRPYLISSENDSHKQDTEDFFMNMKLSSVLKTSAIQAFGFGDCYWNLINSLTAFAVISAETMRIVSDKFGTIEAYIQRVLCNPVDKLVFFPSDIEHMKLADLGSELYGFTPMESLFSTVTELLRMENFDADFFKNNGIPRGAWFFEGMDETTYKRMMMTIKKMRDKGWQRDLAFHMENESGRIKYQRISETQQEMDFKDGKKYQRDKISIGSGVSKLVLGDPEGSNKATGYVQHESFARPVRSMQLLFEDALNSIVIPKFLGFTDTKIIIPPPDFHSPAERIKNQHFFTMALANGVKNLNITDEKEMNAVRRTFFETMGITIETNNSNQKALLSGANGTSSHSLSQGAEDQTLSNQSPNANKVLSLAGNSFNLLKSKIKDLYSKALNSLDGLDYSKLFENMFIGEYNGRIYSKKSKNV